MDALVPDPAAEIRVINVISDEDRLLKLHLEIDDNNYICEYLVEPGTVRLLASAPKTSPVRSGDGLSKFLAGPLVLPWSHVLPLLDKWREQERLTVVAWRLLQGRQTQ